MPKISLGPWPAGADNVQEEHASAFQVAKGKRGRLTEAVNVDISDEGWPKQRDGTTNRRTGVDYRGLSSCAGLLLLQDGGTIYSVDPDDSFAVTSLVTGLHATTRVWFHDFASTCYYTNGITCGKITSAGVATHWGLEPPSAPTTSGSTSCTAPVELSLSEGKYKLCATVLDSSGAESGASPVTLVGVAGSSSITVDVATIDSNAVSVNFYITTGAQDKMCWAKTVAVGSLPTTITGTRVSTRPLLTQFLRNPIPGAGVASYLGYVFTWRANTVFRSRGQTPNLFHPRSEILTFPSTVRSVVGLSDGFYVATDSGLYWISGNDPQKWRAKKKDSGSYSSAGTKVTGEKIPSLRYDGIVALMASDDGLVAGLPGGQIQFVTDRRLKLSASSSEGEIVYAERGDLKQIATLLQ